MKSSIGQVFLSDVGSKVVLAFVGVALIRYMPQEEYASYTFAIAVATLVSQTVAGSFNRIYIVGYDRLGLIDAQWSILTLQMVAALTVILMGMPLSHYFDGIYWLIGVLILVTCLYDFSKTFVQRELNFFRFSLIEILRALGTAVGLALVIYLAGFDLKAWQVLVVQCGALIIVFLAFTGPHIDVRKLLRVHDVSALAGSLINSQYRYLFAYFLLLALFVQLDVLMLRLLSDDMHLATYGSAFRYYSILSLALGAVHAVFLPLIQQLKRREDLIELFASHRNMALLFLPFVVMVGWLSGRVIPWVDVGKYPDSVMVFRILCASVVVSFLFSPHVHLIMRFERFKFLLILISCSLIINVILNYVLIPKFGATGVAVATLIASGSVTFSIYLKSKSLTVSGFADSTPANKSA